VLPGAAEVGDDEATDPEGAAGFDGAGALCAAGWEACSGDDVLLLHPALQKIAAGSKKEAASLTLLDIEDPQQC
jgi:hypothetical protein